MQRRSKAPPSPARAVKLDRIIGLTSRSNSMLSLSPTSDQVSYVAGCCVVTYNWSSDKQTKFFKTPSPIRCIAYSPNGRMLAVGTHGGSGGGSVYIFDCSANRVLKTWRNRHKYGIACLAWSPDSLHLVTVGHKYDAYVKVWNVRKGVVVASNLTSKRKMCAVRFSSDGRYFAIVGERHATFWQMPDEHSRVIVGRRLVVNRSSGLSRMSYVDVDCDKTGSSDRVTWFYAVSSTGKLCLLDAASRTLQQWVDLSTGSGWSVCVTKKLILCGCNQAVVRIFDVETLQYLGTVPAIPNLRQIFQRTGSPAENGESSSSAPGSASADEPAGTNSALDTDHRPSACVACVCSPQGLLHVIYSDRSFFVWDISNLGHFEVKRSFLAHSRGVWDAVSARNRSSTSRMVTSGESAVSSPPPLPTDSVVTVSADGSVRVWHFGWTPVSSSEKRRSPLSTGATVVRTGHELEPCRSTVGQSRSVFCRDLLYASDVDPFLLPGQVSPSRNRNATPSLLMSSPSIGGQELGGGGGTAAPLADVGYTIGDSDISEDREDGVAVLRCVGFAKPDGSFAVVGDRDGVVRVFDVVEGFSCVACQKIHDSEIISVDFVRWRGNEAQPSSSSSSSSAVDSVSPVRRVRGVAPTESFRVEGGLSPTESSEECFLVATGSRDRKIRLMVFRRKWTGHGPEFELQEVGTLTDHSSAVTCVRFVGTRLVSSSNDKTMVFREIWDGQDGSINVHRYGHASFLSAIYDIAPNPVNPNHVVIAASDDVKLVNIATTKHMSTFHLSYEKKTPSRFGARTDPRDEDWDPSSKQPVRVALSPSGKFVAASYTDRNIRVFGYETGKCVAQLTGHAEMVTGMIFSSDKKRLISVSADGCIFVWKLSPHLGRIRPPTTTSRKPTRAVIRHVGVIPPNDESPRLDVLSVSPTGPESSRSLPSSVLRPLIRRERKKRRKPRTTADSRERASSATVTPTPEPTIEPPSPSHASSDDEAKTPSPSKVRRSLSASLFDTNKLPAWLRERAAAGGATLSKTPSSGRPVSPSKSKWESSKMEVLSPSTQLPGSASSLHRQVFAATLPPRPQTAEVHQPTSTPGRKKRVRTSEESPSVRDSQKFIRSVRQIIDEIDQKKLEIRSEARPVTAVTQVGSRKRNSRRGRSVRPSSASLGRSFQAVSLTPATTYERALRSFSQAADKALSLYDGLRKSPSSGGIEARYEESFRSSFSKYHRLFRSRLGVMSSPKSVQTDRFRMASKTVQTSKKRCHHRGVDTSDLGSYVGIAIADTPLTADRLELTIDRVGDLIAQSVLSKLDGGSEFRGSSRRRRQ